jgi:hypothetical protein
LESRAAAKDSPLSPQSGNPRLTRRRNDFAIFPRGREMKRFLCSALVAAALAGGAAPAAAWERWSPGAAAGVGLLGGVALGAALAAPRPVYVAPRPVYVAPPAYAYDETCYVRRERVWVPGWGWELRRRTVCG